jgi:hypothetical protein
MYITHFYRMMLSNKEQSNYDDEHVSRINIINRHMLINIRCLTVKHLSSKPLGSWITET